MEGASCSERGHLRGCLEFFLVLKTSNFPRSLGLLLDCHNTAHFCEEVGTAEQGLCAFLGTRQNGFSTCKFQEAGCEASWESTEERKVSFVWFCASCF